MITLVEYNIFPKPVRGDIIPPDTKVKNPIIAEAFPEFCLSRSKANVVDVGKIIPKKNKRQKNVISITMIEPEIHKAITVIILMAIKPFTPVSKPSSVVENFVMHKFPIMIANAFIPKQKLYAIGER